MTCPFHHFVSLLLRQYVCWKPLRTNDTYYKRELTIARNPEIVCIQDISSKDGQVERLGKHF